MGKIARVKLRQRVTKGGKISLYLDFYAKGERWYEYLSLYLMVDPQTTVERQENRRVLQLAETVRAKRHLEIQNNEFGFKTRQKEEESFFEFFDNLAQSKTGLKSKSDNWAATRKHLLAYAGHRLTFSQIDVDFVAGFKKHLASVRNAEKPLSANTQRCYFCKLVTVLNEAVNEDYMVKNPANAVKKPKAIESERNYLDMSEITKLFKTDCKHPVLKKAFLFSCLTGLRFSDVQQLTWGQVVSLEGHGRIIFKQQKTKGLEYLDVNPQAIGILGERKEPSKKVFDGLVYSAWMNMELQKWISRAGITKDITFHCARHTFAVMMIGLGTEIFTVSKLLGHKDLKTTQVYAKVLDKSKQDAVAKIPDMIGSVT